MPRELRLNIEDRGSALVTPSYYTGRHQRGLLFSHHPKCTMIEDRDIVFLSYQLDEPFRLVVKYFYLQCGSWHCLGSHASAARVWYSDCPRIPKDSLIIYRGDGGRVRGVASFSCSVHRDKRSAAQKANNKIQPLVGREVSERQR